MKTIEDFLKEKIFINEQDYAYFTLENNKVYINYKELKILYDMIYNPLYYKELLIGAKQLVKYYLLQEIIKEEKNLAIIKENIRGDGYNEG